MSNLPEHSLATRRRRMRTRISNQVAAFAAIMLFASTQVSLDEDSERTALQGMPDLTSVTEGAGDSAPAFSLDEPAIGPATSDRNTRSSSGRSKKRLNLNLFRLRP